MSQKTQLKPKANQSKDICHDNGDEVKEAMLLAAVNEKRPNDTKEDRAKPNRE